eukprot:5793835-Pyramimonas_sp.AAC.1
MSAQRWMQQLAHTFIRNTLILCRSGKMGLQGVILPVYITLLLVILKLSQTSFELPAVFTLPRVDSLCRMRADGVPKEASCWHYENRNHNAHMLAYVPGDSDAVTKLMEEAFVTLRRQTNSPVDRDYGLSLLPLKTVEDLQDYYETITYPASFADGTKLYAGIVFDDKSVKSLEEGSFGDTRFQAHHPLRLHTG